MTFKLDIKYHAMYILSGDIIHQIRHSLQLFPLGNFFFESIVLNLPLLNNKYWLLSRSRLQQKAHISGMFRIGPCSIWTLVSITKNQVSGQETTKNNSKE